jgi:hypothetical protein
MNQRCSQPTAAAHARPASPREGCLARRW